MAFEKFVRGGRGFKPKLSIRKGGQIGLNQGAVRRFGLSDGMRVFLYYDKERRMVGIEALKDETAEGSRALRIRQGSASIAAKAFCDYYSIDYKESKSYAVEQDTESGYLVVQLESPMERERR